jgi:serine/threonine protein kinase
MNHADRYRQRWHENDSAPSLIAHVEHECPRAGAADLVSLVLVDFEERRCRQLTPPIQDYFSLASKADAPTMIVEVVSTLAYWVDSQQGVPPAHTDENLRRAWPQFAAALARSHEFFANELLPVNELEFVETLRSVVSPSSAREGDCFGHARLIGRTIGGRFTIQWDIHRGTQSTVYYGLDSVSKVAVAIKVWRPGDPYGVQGERLLHREYDALLRVQDVNGIQPICVGTDDTQSPPVHYLVTKFDYAPVLAGEWLEWSFRKKLGFFVRLCTLLSRCHDRSTLHGDLKPSNVLAAAGDHGPTPRLIDFGAGRTPNMPPPDPFHRPKTGLADSQRRGTTVPEPLRASSDIRALGRILQLIILGDFGTQRHSKLLRGVLAFPLRGVVRRAMADDPENRHSSARELGKAIETYLWWVSWRGLALALVAMATVVFVAQGAVRLQREFMGSERERVELRQDNRDLTTELGKCSDESAALRQSLRSIEEGLARDESTRYRSSSTLIEHVPSDRSPTSTPTTVTLFLPRSSTSKRLTMHAAGQLPATLGSRWAIPAVVSRALGEGEDARVVGGLVADVRADERGDELVVAQRHRLYFPSRIMVLPLDQRFPTRPLNEVWNAGFINALHYNQKLGKLVVLATSNRLSWAIPESEHELGGWSRQCISPGNVSLYPNVVIVIDPEALSVCARGTIFPLSSTADWPSLPIESFLVQPPVREAVAESDVQHVELDSVEPPPPHDAAALCTLTVSFNLRSIDDAKLHYAEVVLYPDGSFGGSWRPLESGVNSADVQAKLFDRLIPLDTAQLASGLAVLREMEDTRFHPDTVIARLDSAGARDPASVTARAISRTRSRNPTWLLNSSMRTLCIGPRAEIEEVRQMLSSVKAILREGSSLEYTRWLRANKCMLAVRSSDATAVDSIRSCLQEVDDPEVAPLLRLFEVLALAPLDTAGARGRLKAITLPAADVAFPLRDLFQALHAEATSALEVAP